MKQEIKITCDTKLYLPLENILDFQGELKSLSSTNYERLKKQILEQGFSAPIFVWKNNAKYYCLDGTQRRLVLTKLKAEGYKIPDLPAVEIFAKTKLEAKKKLLSYVSQFGKVESQGLYEFIIEAEIPIEDMADFEIPEIDMDEFKAEYFADDPPAGAGSEDNIPEVAQNELGVKLGDIFELGEHRLMCGDSTDLATVEKLMNGEKADMVSTDPPYGMDLDTDRRGMGNTTTVFKKVIGDSEPFDPSFIFDFFPKTPIVLWGADYYCHRISHWSDGSPLVWAKAHSEEENKVWGSSFETAWVWPKKKRLLWFIRRIHMGSEHEGTHPTQKPTEITIKALDLFSIKHGSVVVDLFLGSGSTLIACEKTKCKCYGLELDPHYCSVIIKRWEEYSGKKHKKIS
jgi:hypothetical protein